MKKLAGVLMVAFLLAGSAAHADPLPSTFRSERVYFHCGPTKVANVHMLQGVASSWDPTAPTQSMQAGAGCGAVDVPVAAGTATVNPYDGAWSGTFTGNVKSLTVEAHMIYVGAARAGGDVGFQARLAIDGMEVIPEGDSRVVRVTPVKSSTGASDMIRFTISGLEHFTELEQGDGTTERTFTLTLHSYFVDQNPLVTWVFDATDAPSGITFNPAIEESYAIQI